MLTGQKSSLREARQERIRNANDGIEVDAVPIEREDAVSMNRNSPEQEVDQEDHKSASVEDDLTPETRSETRAAAARRLKNAAKSETKGKDRQAAREARQALDEEVFGSEVTDRVTIEREDTVSMNRTSAEKVVQQDDRRPSPVEPAQPITDVAQIEQILRENPTVRTAAALASIGIDEASGSLVLDQVNELEASQTSGRAAAASTEALQKQARDAGSSLAQNNADTQGRDGDKDNLPRNPPTGQGKGQGSPSL